MSAVTCYTLGQIPYKLFHVTLTALQGGYYSTFINEEIGAQRRNDLRKRRNLSYFFVLKNGKEKNEERLGTF